MSTANSQDFPGEVEPQQGRSAVARAAGVIGLATLVSRVLGFARDVVIARTFGTLPAAQAFVVAFRIPNLLRDFLAEGAGNAALVPVFSEYKARRSAAEFWELAQVVLTALLVILSAVTLLGMLAAPLLVRLAAPGFAAAPEKLELTVRLTRVLFPYIIFVSLAAYAMGVLNSLRRFTVSAFAPCLLNLALIVFTLWFGENVAGLACGALVGGLLQLAVQVPALYRAGFRPAFSLRFRHPGAVAIGRLLIPRFLSSGIYQANNFVDSIFGSLAWIVGEGAVVMLYFAYHLILFPLGIFSTALSQAILPVFSAQVVNGEPHKLAGTFSWAMRLTFFALLPASAGFIALAEPLVGGVFGGGKFDAAAVSATAAALVCYSAGLCAYGGTRILQSCFYAMKDTRTPARAAALALGLNVVLNAALIFPLKLCGIAAATALSAIAAFVVLFLSLKKRLGGISLRELAVSFTRIACAAACMGLVAHVLYHRFFPAGPGTLGQLAKLGLTIAASAASYALLCAALRVREFRETLDWIKARMRR